MSVLKIFLLALLISLCGIAQSFATNYYIDAANGNDGNDGTSTGTAWRSIGKVNSFAFQPGDSILFKSGQRWSGTRLLVNSKGTDSGRIVYGKYGGTIKPILSRLQSSGRLLEGYTLSYVTFQDIEFRGDLYIGNTAVSEGVHNLRFLRITVDGNASGDVTGAYGLQMLSNFTETAPEVWEFNPFYNIEVAYSEFKNTSHPTQTSACVHIWGLTQNLWIHHNVFSNARVFVGTAGGDNITIEYNKMIGSSNVGIKMQSQIHSVDNLVIRGNLIIGSALEALIVYGVKNSHIYNNTIRQNPGSNSAVAVFGWEGASQPYFCGVATNNSFFNNRIENNIFIGEWINLKRANGVEITYKDGTKKTFTMNDLWVDNYFNNNVIYQYSGEHSFNSDYRIAVTSKGGAVTWDSQLGYYSYTESNVNSYFIFATEINTVWNAKSNVSNELFSDPLIVDPTYVSPTNYGDYQLTENSPARESGIIITDYLYDLMGNIIPASTNPDRGPFQSNSSILNPDITPPNLLSAEINSGTSLILTFSEPVQSTEAQNKSNYTINNGIIVTNALLHSNNTQVTLTASEHSTNINYTVTVSNIKDLANNIISNTGNSAQYIIESSSSGITVINAKIYLEGAYSNSLMNTTLLENGLIPTAQPYSPYPWNHSPQGEDLFKPGRGDYESNIGSWVAYGNNTIGISSEYSYSGSKSFKLTRKSNSQGGYLYLNSSADLNSNLVVGNKYKLEFWGKVSSGSLKLKIIDAANSSIPDYSVTITSIAKKHEIEFTATSTTMNCIRFDAMTSNQSVFIDNISLLTAQGESEVVASIPTNIVDWVLIELRTGTAASTTVARRAAFLRNDGIVVDLDGLSKVAFPEINGGDYYIVIKHRNHLAIMSRLPVRLTGNSILYDLLQEWKKLTVRNQWPT
jgi:hypothetical protein